MSDELYRRKARLLAVRPSVPIADPSDAFATSGGTLDLSEMHFRFRITQMDAEAPNTATIRVFNLARATVDALIRDEFSRVILQAGYEGNEGVIFDGTIKQFRRGRENATDTFVEILAADGDLAYLYPVMNKTLAAGWKQTDVIDEARKAMAPFGVTKGFIDTDGLLGGVVPNARGKVLWGLPRVALRVAAETTQSTWSIENGKLNVIPLTGYKPDEAVVLSSLTGLVGIPEQTNEGIRARSLLNPKITIGSAVQIDNKTINQILQQSPTAAPVPFNQWAGLQLLATVAADGLYRVFVAEHEGDTRGQAWYTDLVCLSINPTTQKVKPYG